jgi:hypothetical protein
MSITHAHVNKSARSSKYICASFFSSPLDLEHVLEESWVGEDAHDKNLKNWKTIRDRVAGGGSAAWYGGVHNLEQLRALLHDGWPEGTTRARELTRSLESSLPPSIAPRRRPRWGDDGDEISLERLYMGNLDQMWRGSARTLTHAPRIITIDIAVGGNSGVQPEALFWSGVPAILLADMLEDQNYRVELYATASAEVREGYGSTKGYSFFKRVRLKRADEPLRIDTIAAMTAHAAIFRGYLIPAASRSRHATGSGFGSSEPITPNLERLAELEIIAPSDITIEHSYTRQAAKQSIEAAIRTINAQETHA